MHRTTVTFTSPSQQSRSERADEAYEYPTSPDGLEKFNLGSVPASVTPPRTWRKAAWFAALASGGVVAALLVAGSVLVGQPPMNRHALDSWPDRRGGAPMLPSEEYADAADSTSAVSPSPRTAPASSSSETAAGDRTAALRTPTSASSSMSSPVPTSREPQKPPITPASTSTVGYTLLWSAYDAEAMAKHSQDYFNTVTEDPETAYALTTGELAAEGPEGLQQKYTDIAYFEVRHVYIDDNRGFTMNAVEVTYKDGSKTEQTHTLVFDGKEKIVEDTAESESAEDTAGITAAGDPADAEDTADPESTGDAGDTE